jgi:hypothetical protein
LLTWALGGPTRIGVEPTISPSFQRSSAVFAVTVLIGKIRTADEVDEICVILYLVLSARRRIENSIAVIS